MKWEPITKVELVTLIDSEIKKCTITKYVEVFNKYKVEPYQVEIDRSGKIENVFVVAENGNEVMFYEDVEEGFNISSINENGIISEYSVNQDECWVAAKKWNI